MYNHLTGAVARINSERLVIEVSGVGYHVTINCGLYAAPRIAVGVRASRVSRIYLKKS